MAGGGKGGQGGVPPEFKPVLDLTSQAFAQGMGRSGQDLGFDVPEGGGKFGRAGAGGGRGGSVAGGLTQEKTLPMGALEELSALSGTSALDFGRIGAEQGPDLFGQALSGLSEGMEQGYTSNVLPAVEARLRPMAELGFDYLSADILEGAAGAGTTRSTHTTETLSRGKQGIEAGLQQTLGGIEGQLAPLQAQQRERAVGAGLGLPAGVGGQLAALPTQALGARQFAQSLPAMYASGAGGVGGVPYQPAGNPFGDFLSVGIPAAAAMLGGPGAGAAAGKGGGK